MQIDAPADDDNPVGQGGQYPSPLPVAHVPGEQFVQNCEAILEYVPGLHKMHGIVQPGPEYWPAPHGVHTVWPINL